MTSAHSVVFACIVGLLWVRAVLGSPCSSLETHACKCESIGAAEVLWPNAPVNTCRLYVEHQGRQRFADVFFPSNYSSSSDVPLWLQLHGLFKPRWPANSSDEAAIERMNRAAEGQARSWGVVNSWLLSKAVHVYPDATGEYGQPQFWNSGFWQCAAGRCMEEGLDDFGFLEKLLMLLLERLPAKPPQARPSKGTPVSHGSCSPGALC
eukprot:gene13830-13949_t